MTNRSGSLGSMFCLGYVSRLSSCRCFHLFPIACFLLALLLLPIAKAQFETATLSGTVTDPSGAVVKGAEVRALRVEIGVETVVKTNDSGFYIFTGLQPGSYRIFVSKTGFKQISLMDMNLNIQETVNRNFSLEVGAASETVVVKGNQINMNTTDGTVSTLVDATTITNMPLNGRSFQDLILLTPGVQTNPVQSPGNAIGQTGEFSVNGQRTEDNYYTVDGVSANTGAQGGIIAASGSGRPALLYGAGSLPSSTALGTTQSLVSVDDLQEFRVQTSTYSSEYGRTPGGQFGFETKSGTNQWHGDAFDYLRNNVFDANDWFNDYQRIAQPPLRQNDFGGSLGGPVRIPRVYNGKDKTFFFVNYEGLRLTLPQEATPAYFPDACMRGIKTSTITYNSSGQCLLNGSPILDCTIPIPTNTPQSGVAFACANPPPTRRGPTPPGTVYFRTPATSALLPIINAFPLPQFNPEYDILNGLGESKAAFSDLGTIDTTSVRFDQVITSKMTAFFRFSDTSSGLQKPNYETTISTPFLNRSYTGGVSNIFSSRLSNEFRLNYTFNSLQSIAVDGPFGGNSPFPNGSYNLTTYYGLPAAGSGNFTYVSAGGEGFVSMAPSGPTENTQKQWNFVDTVSYTVGAHQLKFGVDYLRLASSVVAPPETATYYFIQSEQSIETGAVGERDTAAYDPYYPLTKDFSAFANDSWKVSRRLTLSFGLRWEVDPPVGVTQGILPYNIVGTTPSTYALSPENTPEYQTTWFNFAPRLGAAYQVRTAPGWETVVRGGFGVFYDTGQQLGISSFFGPGYSALVLNFTNPGVFPTNPSNPTTGVLPTIPTTYTSYNQIIQQTQMGNPPLQIYGFAPHLQLPYTLQWNASIEQALGRSQAFTVSYVGSHGSRLLQSNEYIAGPMNSNSARGFVLTQNGLTSDYDALQLQYQHRLAAGLTVLGSYTWSHCIDYGSVNVDTVHQRGNCDFDVRRNFSAAISYDLPNVGSNKIVRAIVDHWGIDDRFAARTAMPVFLRSQDTITNSIGEQLNASYNTVLSAGGKPVPPVLYGAACNVFFESYFQSQGTADSCPGGKAINPCAFVQNNGDGTTSSLPFASTALCGYNVNNPTVGGLAPRNQLRGYGLVQMDVAIRREFPIYERLKLQFRAEAFNVFNHPNFGVIDLNIRDSSFGLAAQTLANSLGVLSGQYQAGGPRSMQFALKLIF